MQKKTKKKQHLPLAMIGVQTSIDASASTQDPSSGIENAFEDIIQWEAEPLLQRQGKDLPEKYENSKK